jgi:sn-glycerol 3-phosphate transport system ATP-binding protein
MPTFEAVATGGRLSHAGLVGDFAPPAAWTVPDGPTVVGVRAEDLRPLAPGEPDAPATLKGEIGLIETLGHAVLLHFTLPGGAAMIAKSFSHHGLPKVGDTVRAAIDVARLHLFDPATGRRLEDGGPA